MNSSANAGNTASSLATLIETLQDQLVVVPLDPVTKDRRAKSARLLLEGIDAYGVDSASLLRHGMKIPAVTPVLVLLLSNLLPSGQQPELFDGETWAERLAVPISPLDPIIEEDGRFSFQLAGDTAGIARLLERWVERADIAEIIDLVPPGPNFFAALDPPSLPQEVMDPYKWLAVRHSGRGFETWDLASLRLEFLAREQEWHPPFSSQLEYPIAAEEDDGLLREMARRLAGSEAAEAGPGRELLAQLQRQAIQFLAARRYREASALFEFYLRSYPSDVSAMNNMGFCLIPIDTEVALHHLAESASRGFDPLTVNIYNQCCCLRDLGRSGEALELAEYHWQRGLVSRPIAGTLWKRSLDGWELYQESDCAAALASLAVELAGLANRTDRIQRWMERSEKNRSHGREA